MHKSSPPGCRSSPRAEPPRDAAQRTDILQRVPVDQQQVGVIPVRSRPLRSLSPYARAAAEVAEASASTGGDELDDASGRMPGGLAGAIAASVPDASRTSARCTDPRPPGLFPNVMPVRAISA